MGGSNFMEREIAHEQAATKQAEAEAAATRQRDANARSKRWEDVVPDAGEMSLAGAARRLAKAWADCLALRLNEGGGDADLVVTTAAPGAPAAAPAAPSGPSHFRLFLAGSGDVRALGNFMIAAAGVRLADGVVATPGITPGCAPLLPPELSAWSVPLYLRAEPGGFAVHAVASRAALRAALHAATDTWLDEDLGWAAAGGPYEFGDDVKDEYVGTLSLLAWDTLAALCPNASGADEMAEALRVSADAVVEALLTALLPAQQDEEEQEVSIPLLAHADATAEGYAAAVACLASVHADRRRHAWCRVELAGPLAMVQAMQAHVPEGSCAWLALAPHNTDVEYVDAPACLPRKLAAVAEDAAALMLVPGARRKESTDFLRAILPRCVRSDAQVVLVNGEDSATARDGAAGIIRELHADARAFADGAPGLTVAERNALRQLRIRPILAERRAFQEAMQAGRTVPARQADEAHVAQLLGFPCCLTLAAELSDVRALQRDAEAERAACKQVAHLPKATQDRLLAFCSRGSREAGNQRDVIRTAIQPVVGSDAAVAQRWATHWGGAAADATRVALLSQAAASRAALAHAGRGKDAAERLEREVTAVTNVYIEAAEAAWDGFVRGHVTAGVAALAVPSHAELNTQVRDWLNDQAGVWLDGRAEGQSSGDKAARATNLFRALAPREAREAQGANPLLRWTSEPWGRATPVELVEQRPINSLKNAVVSGKCTAAEAFETLLGTGGAAQRQTLLVRMLAMLQRPFKDILHAPELRTKLLAALLAAHMARGESIQRALEQRQATLRLGDDGAALPGLCGRSSASASLELSTVEAALLTQAAAAAALEAAGLPARYLEQMPFCHVFLRGKTKFEKMYPKAVFAAELARAQTVPESQFLRAEFAGERQLAKFVECCLAYIAATDDREKHAGLAVLRDSGRVQPEAGGGGAGAARTYDDDSDDGDDAQQHLRPKKRRTDS